MPNLPDTFNNWPQSVQDAARNALKEGAGRVRDDTSAEAVFESIWNAIVQEMEAEQEGKL